MIGFLPLKAEIHGFPAAKLVDWLDDKCYSYSLPYFRAVENNHLEINGLMRVY
jgi:hypothetical protein